VYARLSPGFGWTYQDETGVHPIVLSNVQRYAGMVSGKAVHDGRLWARPLPEFEALSVNGIEWKPFYQLRALIPWETHVQQVELPVQGTDERAA
jgi:hypothetical protein